MSEKTRVGLIALVIALFCLAVIYLSAASIIGDILAVGS